jgi:hypothetical protein
VRPFDEHTWGDSASAITIVPVDVGSLPQVRQDRSMDSDEVGAWLALLPSSQSPRGGRGRRHRRMYPGRQLKASDQVAVARAAGAIWTASDHLRPADPLQRHSHLDESVSSSSADVDAAGSWTGWSWRTPEPGAWIAAVRGAL